MSSQLRLSVSKRALVFSSALSLCSFGSACASSHSTKLAVQHPSASPQVVAVAAPAQPRVIIAAPPPAPAPAPNNGQGAAPNNAQPLAPFTPTDSPLLAYFDSKPHGQPPAPMDPMLAPKPRPSRVVYYAGPYGYARPAYAPYYGYAPYGYYGGYYGAPRVGFGVGFGPYYRFGFGGYHHHGYGHHGGFHHGHR